MRPCRRSIWDAARPQAERKGVGKSTTLKSIMGLVKTPHGAIELDGEDIIRRPTYERAAAGLGYVPQGRDIFPQMTV